MDDVTDLMHKIARRNGLADEAQLRAIVAAGSNADAPSDQMVSALMGTGKVKAGLGEGEKLLAQGRMEPLAIHVMALGYLLKKKEQAAIQVLTAGIEQHPSSFYLRTSLSQALVAVVGRANTKKSQKPELMARATSAAQLAIQLDSTDELAHLALARIQIRAGRNFHAEQDARAVLAIDPNSHDAHQMLGVLAKEREAFEEAAAHFVEAARLDAGKESVRSLRRLRKQKWLGGVLPPSTALLAFTSVNMWSREYGKSTRFTLIATAAIVAFVFVVYLLWIRLQSRAALSAEAKDALKAKPARRP